MNICIVVHSFTGNTMSVAEALMKGLVNKGHSVVVERLEVVGGEDRNQQDIDKISFKIVPDPSDFDALVIAGPVRGFSISPVLKACITKMDTFKDKPVAIFVTHAFPFSFMGGKSAIGQIERLCVQKSADIVAKGIIDWGNKKRDIQIENLVKGFSEIL